jgi:hypothetical protein
VTVAVTDDAGIVSTTGFLVHVTPEDAEATYTGDAIAFGRDGATVLLRATMRDGSVLGGDSTAGDIRTGTVSFAAGGKPLCTGAVGLLGTAPTAASASCTATLPFGVHDVTVAVGGNYTGTASGRLEVSRSQNKTVLAGTTLTAARSSGAFPADQGSRTTVALLVGHTRAGSATTGLATATFQSGGRRYQIIGTGFDSFGVSGHAVDLRSRATLIDVTQPGRPVPVASGATLRITGTDTGLFSGTDSLALTLMQGERLLLSSDWTGASTTEIPVTTGNLLII